MCMASEDFEWLWQNSAYVYVQELLWLPEAQECNQELVLTRQGLFVLVGIDRAVLADASNKTASPRAN